MKGAWKPLGAALALLLATAVGATATAIDPAQLYPRLAARPAGAPDRGGLAYALGNGLVVTLVADFDGIVKDVQPSDLKTMGLTPAQAQKRALENLSLYFRGGKLRLSQLSGPRDGPYVLCDGYWLCSSLILYPELADWAGEILGSEDLYLSVPHRDALFVFKKGKKSDPGEWKKFIAQQASEGTDQLTPELFEIKDKSVRPVAAKPK